MESGWRAKFAFHKPLTLVKGNWRAMIHKDHRLKERRNVEKKEKGKVDGYPTKFPMRRAKELVT